MTEKWKTSLPKDKSQTSHIKDLMIVVLRQVSVVLNMCRMLCHMGFTGS